MENKEFSLLIMGYFESVFIIQFVKNLKKNNPNAKIYYWGRKPNKEVVDKDYINCYEDYCFYDISHKIKVPVLNKIDAVLQYRKCFKSFILNRHFDYINIHFVRPEYFLLMDYMKKCSSKIVLTPWGSDVYRVKKTVKFLVNRIYKKADIVTGRNNRFTRDVIRIFEVPDVKMHYCELGVESFDYIVENKKHIDTDIAKKKLGLGGKYVITCGYNAIRAQQHLSIIDSIYKIKNELPSNLMLLFPFTYPQDNEYKAQVKERIKERGLDAVYFEEFLDVPNLYLVRMATDMFIHVQTTDAFSASFMEYLLCEKKIVNGKWLKYPELEKNGVVPYFEVDSMDHLDECILHAYLSAPISIANETFEEIEKKQWKGVIKKWSQLFSEQMA